MLLYKQWNLRGGICLPNLNTADFYYGALLSALVTRHITPAIIESSDARQIYCLTTNDREFYMFVKYRSTPTTNNETFTSRSFTFSDSDISELQKLLNSDKDLSLGLICGNTPQHTSQYAILHNHEISQIMSLGKKSLTIRSKKREHNFCIPISDGNSQDIRIAKKTAY